MFASSRMQNRAVGTGSAGWEIVSPLSVYLVLAHIPVSIFKLLPTALHYIFFIPFEKDVIYLSKIFTYLSNTLCILLSSSQTTATIRTIEKLSNPIEDGVNSIEDDRSLPARCHDSGENAFSFGPHLVDLTSLRQMSIEGTP